MPSKYADNFALQGIMRIGTAHGFRAIEDSEIGDRGEATIIHNARLPNFASSPDVESGNISFINSNGQQLLGFNNLKGASILNNIVRATYNYNDMYIFCVSDAPPTEEFMKRIGYDSCISISDIDKFNKIVSRRIRAMSISTGNYAIYDCDYKGREHVSNNKPAVLWNSPSSPYFKKEERYAYQHEVRVVFQPITLSPIKAVNITCGDIAELCTRIF